MSQCLPNMCFQLKRPFLLYMTPRYKQGNVPESDPGKVTLFKKGVSVRKQV